MESGKSLKVQSTLDETEISKYGQIRVGLKMLDDATLDINEYGQIKKDFGNKQVVLDALYKNDLVKLRDISSFFFKVSGIYSRLCRYMAYLYRYDWIVTPYIGTEKNTKKILEIFHEILFMLDSFNIKKFLGNTALKVIKYGSYYGYIMRSKGKITIQELPVDYCRSRFTDIDGFPIVEFNMKYFDDAFFDVAQRTRVLNLFPKEFRKGYIAYKNGRLQPDFIGDEAGWYVLEEKAVIKFNLNEEDVPFFSSVIPYVIDLADAQGLDRKKMQQRLLKILIQRMPIDKNGDPVFDIPDVKEFHKNAVQMLSRAIGLDVLTTYADVSVEDMDDSADEATDELERVERAVYNESGVSQMQFNTDGNIALEKSVLNDEASLYNLIAQFESFLNLLLIPYNKNPKKILYKIQLLSTTIYNYKELSKMYSDQTKIGYSKMLPQIALGQSQSSVLANAYFENDVLNLAQVFIPPLTSNTMNGETLAALSEDDNKGGRPAKSDDEKSEKTIQNQESIS